MADVDISGQRRSQLRSVSGGDEPVDVQRYLGAVRREWRLVVALVLFITLLTVVLSMTATASYRATSRVVFNDIGLVDRQDVESVRRELATLRALVETPAVLNRAAKTVSGLSGNDIDDRVSTSVDPNTNIITVSATDRSPVLAARIANAVTTAFITSRRQVERAQLERARAVLANQLASLGGAPGTSTQAQALRDRISELNILIASAGSELQTAESARAPEEPYAPRPFRNGVIALFASLLLTIIVVFGREQLRPQISSARELSSFLELPILTRVPWIRARDRRSGILTGAEYDAYQSLQASMRFSTRPEKQTIVLVTSSVHSEGKSRVTAGLGVSLAHSGASTLMIAGDLRSPATHEYFGTAPRTGLGEILSADDIADGGQLRGLIAVSARPIRTNLYLLASTAKRNDAVELLSSDALEAFFEELSYLGYEYVLVDAPPLLGIPDTRLLARHADSLLFIGRPDRLTPDLALDAREALDTLNTPVLGLVVVGARGDHTSYYSQPEAPVDMRQAAL